MRRRVVLFAVAVVIAIAGTAMVAVYVNGASGTPATTKTDLVRVLTATGTISTGETAAQAQAAGKFALTPVPRSSVVPGAITSVDTMGDQVALATIYPGEQILALKFGTTVASEVLLPVPKGLVAISVDLTDPGRVAGFLTPGSHVAIFVTVKKEVEEESYTRVLVSSVVVIGVGATTVLSPADTAADPSAQPVSMTVLTVAMGQRDADRVTFASLNETVGFGLLGEDTKFTPDPGVTEADLRK